MAMTPEAKAKKKVKALLDAYGAYHFSPVTGGYGNSGIPDICGVHNGRFFGIEVKADTEVTALQKSHLKQIALCGGFAGVVRINGKVEEGMDELRDFLEGKL